MEPVDLELRASFPSKKREAARLCGSYDDKDLGEAVKLLANAGFEVYASPAHSRVELNYGSSQYVGIKKIRAFVKYHTKTGQILYN